MARPPPHQRPVRHRLVGRADARVHQHQCSEALREQIGRLDGHHAAEAVADHHHVVAEASVVAHRDDLRRISLGVIGVAVVGIAHAGEVHGRDAVFVGKLRRDEVPPAAVGVHAVNQQHGRRCGAAAPPPVDDIALVYLHAVLGRLGLHRLPEPVWDASALAFVPSRHVPLLEAVSKPIVAGNEQRMVCDKS